MKYSSKIGQIYYFNFNFWKARVNFNQYTGLLFSPVLNHEKDITFVVTRFTLNTNMNAKFSELSRWTSKVQPYKLFLFCNNSYCKHLGARRERSLTQ